jgi:hypothetical protein
MGIRDMAPFFAVIVVAIALFALYYDLRSDRGIGVKLLWVLVIVLLPLVGSIIYFLVYGTGAPASDKTAHEGRPQEEQRFGK